MSSSITIAVPAGQIAQWCIKAQLDFDGNINSCANATLGQSEKDFETFCCDGDIVDTEKNIYAWPRPRNESALHINLRDMVCCGVHGPQQGGIGPAINLATACTQGYPTPLASLAATNLQNAAQYQVTYTSASFGSTTTGDFIPVERPTCLWAYTASGVPLSTITMPAAHISTLHPLSTDGWGSTIYGDGAAQASTSSAAISSIEPTVAAATSTSTKSSSASSGKQLATRKGCVLALLGGVVVQLLWFAL